MVRQDLDINSSYDSLYCIKGLDIFQGTVRSNIFFAFQTEQR
jgi:hypothetical protein